MASRDEIETVARRIGRTRLSLPCSQYDLDDARLENAFAWPAGDHPSHIVLTDDELGEAWNRSEQLVRAWA